MFIRYDCISFENFEFLMHINLDIYQYSDIYRLSFEENI